MVDKAQGDCHLPKVTVSRKGNWYSPGPFQRALSTERTHPEPQTLPGSSRCQWLWIQQEWFCVCVTVHTSETFPPVILSETGCSQGWESNRLSLWLKLGSCPSPVLMLNPKAPNTDRYCYTESRQHMWEAHCSCNAWHSPGGKAQKEKINSSWSKGWRWKGSTLQWVTSQ